MYKQRVPDNDTMYPGRSVSKFRGYCRICGEVYYPGHRVNWSPREKGTCCHASCFAVHGLDGITREVPSTPVIPTTPKGVVALPTEDVTPKATSGLGETLASAIAPYLDGKLAGLVTKEQVKGIVNDLCKEMVFKSVSTIEIVQYTEDGIRTEDMGVQHKQFATLLQTMQARTHDGFRLNVWLVGPAGTGKTTAAKNCAKALGLDFQFTGSIDTEYKLMGFVDAQGRVVNTAFRKAYTEGGVFLFDECDSSLPPALLAFNAALANGECAFPDGVKERHKDFVCIAAANTWGLGATNDYVGRLKLDAAFLDRFVQIEWDIDTELEVVTCPNTEWAKKVQKWRASAKQKGIKVVISPRSSYFGASLLATGMVEEMVIAMTVRKAMTLEQWNTVKGGY